MKLIQVLLVENHTLVRAGIRVLLENLEGLEVFGEAGDGREALRKMEKSQPDVVLMDIAMAGMNGLEATARITKKFPKVRVIMLSMYSSEEYVLQALRAGASGYLLKESATIELELAIRAVARGETYLSPAVSKHRVSDYMRRIGQEADPLDRLTPRQREILQLIAEGGTTKSIAEKLHLSPKTAETHRAQLMDRLNIHDIPGLVRFAIRVGLTSPEIMERGRRNSENK